MTMISDAVLKPRQEAFKPLTHVHAARVISREMAKVLISRIEDRLRKLKLSPRAASLLVSTNPDLIRGVLRAGEDANPTQGTIAKIAQAIGVEASYLIDEDSPASSQAHSAEIRRVDGIRYPGQELRKDVGVMGTAAGSIIQEVEGFQYFSQQPVDYVRRPPALSHVTEAYAIYVSGDSMWPMHPAGELRFVNPAKPVAIGDSVIVRTQHWEEDPGQLYIKLLKRRTADWIIVEQLNPEATIQIPRKYVDYIHHVMTMSELFGI